MKANILKIKILKTLHEVFLFCITPPNSTKWIPSIIKEEVNIWPVKIGTIYKLTNDVGEIFMVTVTNIKADQYVEWISEDRNYHCRYTLKTVDKAVELEYREWVDKDKLEEPFTIQILEKLKSVIEAK